MHKPQKRNAIKTGISYEGETENVGVFYPRCRFRVATMGKQKQVWCSHKWWWGNVPGTSGKVTPSTNNHVLSPTPTRSSIHWKQVQRPRIRMALRWLLFPRISKETFCPIFCHTSHNSPTINSDQLVNRHWIHWQKNSNSQNSNSQTSDYHFYKLEKLNFF